MPNTIADPGIVAAARLLDLGQARLGADFVLVAARRAGDREAAHQLATRHDRQPAWRAVSISGLAFSSAAKAGSVLALVGHVAAGHLVLEHGLGLAMAMRWVMAAAPVIGDHRDRNAGAVDRSRRWYL